MRLKTDCENILESFETSYGAANFVTWNERTPTLRFGARKFGLILLDTGGLRMARLNVNGKSYDVDVGPDTPLLWAIRENSGLTKVQQAWINNDVPQCGYCQSGMIMAVTALLKEKPKPTDADIDQSITNICRCGTYQQVRTAIHEAANA